MSRVRNSNEACEWLTAFGVSRLKMLADTTKMPDYKLFFSKILERKQITDRGRRFVCESLSPRRAAIPSAPHCQPFAGPEMAEKSSVRYDIEHST